MFYIYGMELEKDFPTFTTISCCDSTHLTKQKVVRWWLLFGYPSESLTPISGSGSSYFNNLNNFNNTPYYNRNTREYIQYGQTVSFPAVMDWIARTYSKQYIGNKDYMYADADGSEGIGCLIIPIYEYTSNNHNLAQSGWGGWLKTDMIDKIAGAIGVNMDVKEGLIEVAKKSGDIGKAGEKYLSFTKVAGTLMGVTSTVIAWRDYNKNPTMGGLVKAWANTGLMILKVNPFVGVGLGILDLTGGSDWFYKQIGNGIDNIGGPGR